MSRNPEIRKGIPDTAVCVFKGKLFDVYQWEQELYDGSTMTFEKLRRADGAFVIPILANGNILMAEDEQPGREMRLTFPGGGMEAGETPEMTATREMLEETGYTAESLIPYKSTSPTSKMDWMVHAFIGRNCTKVAEPQNDPGERITLREVTFEELVEGVEESHLQNTALLPDLLKAKYNPVFKEELRKIFFG